MKVGDTTVEGKFAWQNPDEVPEAGTHWVNWKFTPIDKKTYTEAIGSVQITVKKAKQSAKLNMTGYTYGEMPVKPELTERIQTLRRPTITAAPAAARIIFGTFTIRPS